MRGETKNDSEFNKIYIHILHTAINEKMVKYDELKRTEGDNPTIGIILCSETDEDIARYSVLKGNEQLFASKYKLYLPTDEELRAEIEAQKTIFKLQHNE